MYNPIEFLKSSCNMTFEAISFQFLILEITLTNFTINFKLVNFKQINVGLTSFHPVSCSTQPSRINTIAEGLKHGILLFYIEDLT